LQLIDIYQYFKMDFSRELINWYHTNKRDLPWRNTNNPYLIWLSEIILQQTRVAQGMPYFLKFADRFPDIISFANAKEDEVLNLWQGLGYYSRARNMLKTAIAIKKNYNGIFPTAYADLIHLTGIGQYTASAISSFAANEVRAVVDGNVYRVLARVFGISTPINSTIGKKEFQKLADCLIDKQNPAAYNQAIMDFGAMLCKPKNPDCSICPLRLNCMAYQHQKINDLPVKLNKVKIKERYFFYFVISNSRKIVIKKRSNDDIWAGLYDFPTIETSSDQSIGEIFDNEQFKLWFDEEAIISKISEPIKHVLTHQKIYARFIEISGLRDGIMENNNWMNVKENDLEHYAQPKLIFAFLKNYLH
jgi:A/G-specific adenine glycosylase